MIWWTHIGVKAKIAGVRHGDMLFANVATMFAESFSLESSQTAKDAGAVPFASEFVTLSKQERIELVMQAHYFQSLHEREKDMGSGLNAVRLNLSRTSRNQTGKKHPRSCAKLLDVQPIYVLANVLEQAERSVVTHWV